MEKAVMQAFAKSFDVNNIEWHHIRGEPGDAYNLDYEYSLLGYDLSAGKLDMLMRFRPGGGFCEPQAVMNHNPARISRDKYLLITNSILCPKK